MPQLPSDPGQLFGTRQLAWEDDDGGTHQVYCDFYMPQIIEDEGAEVFLVPYKFRGLGNESLLYAIALDKVTAMSSAFHTAGRLLSDWDHPIVERL